MSGRAGKHHKKKLSRSQRANLIFPVSRCYRYMKKSIIHKRVSVAAPIYCAAVLEYLCAELMELAGNAARDNSKKRVTPRHILLAIANDDELHKLLKGVTISQGGVLPHIPEVLLYKRSQWTKMANARKQGTTLAAAKATPTKKPSTPKKKTPAKRQSTSKKGKSPNKRVKKVVSDEEDEDEEENEEESTSGGTDMATTVLSEKTLENNGPKLTVVQGDISKVKCDAVIHPTNSSMNLAGLVGRALRAAGGAKLEKDCNQVSSKTSLGVTEAAISGAGNLPCKHVIHVHSPHWSADKGVPELTTTVENALQVAEDKKLKTIAFPSIASGSNDFPKQTAAQTILRTIKHYFRSGVSSSLKQVYFVLYDMESIGVYTTELVRMDTY